LTRKKGVSIEFADYRDYAQGDDLRHLDWNVLARLNSPVIRTYRDEQDLNLFVLLDSSPSMSFGEPSKLDQASLVATALAYIALCSGDAVVCGVLGSRQPLGRALRGRASFPKLVRTLDAPNESSAESLAAGLRRFAATDVPRGVALVVSDGLDPNAESALRAVAARGHEILFLQVLSDVEIDPDLEGDLRLEDDEGGTPVEVTANSSVLAQYRENLRRHNAGLRDAVARSGGRFATITAGEPFESIVRTVFRKERWTA
jgi:uncharacterized protein (DUF58 family)